jgi:methylmalonyl-CoA decarboxylase subunit alpha
MNAGDDPSGAAAWQPVLDDLAERRRAAEAMGGDERLTRRRARGKLDARERIATLCDPGSVVEIGRLVGDLPADAFVAAIGTIDGRPAAVGAEDFTVAAVRSARVVRPNVTDSQSSPARNVCRW